MNFHFKDECITYVIKMKKEKQQIWFIYKEYYSYTEKCMSNCCLETLFFKLSKDELMKDIDYRNRKCTYICSYVQ